MTRQIITFSTLMGLVLAVLAVETQAGGCRSGGCARRNYVRPVTVVRTVRPVVVRVAPVVVAPRPKPNYPVVPSGSSLTLPGNFLGDLPGSVFMVFNNIKLPVQVNRWTQTGVSIKLPPMAIKDPVVIRLDIVLPNGKLGRTQRLVVTAPAPVVLHPGGPTPQLPTAAAMRQTQAIAAGPAVAPAISTAPPVAMARPATGQPIVLPAAFAAPAAQTPIVLPQAGAAAASQQPIVLPAAGAAPNGQQPIVLPRAGAAAASQQPIVLPSAGAARNGQQPIVLPRAEQPQAVPAAPPVTSEPATTDAEQDDPMADNPILNEFEETEVQEPVQEPAQDSENKKSATAGLLSLILSAMQK